MIRYLTKDGNFWKATVFDDIIEIRQGTIGTDGEFEVVDPWETLSTPPEYALDELAMPLFDEGYRPAPIPLIETVIEQAHGITLPEPVRSFFADQAYWTYQGWHCKKLNCGVDFTTDAVLGNYHQEHWDSDRGETRIFVPISGRLYNGAPDEQQWIGIDPDDVQVYALYTSGDFDPAYESFDAFLADLVEPE